MINFYLKDKNTQISTAIQMVVFYENTRLKIATGCSVSPKLWQEKKQRVKVTMEFPNGHDINDKLDQIEIVMNSLLKKYRDQNYYPDREKIKQDFFKQNDVPIKNKKSKMFWDHFEDFIETKRKMLDDIRDYNNSLRKHLVKVELKMNKKLTFDMVSIEESGFSENWKNYLTFEALNSIGDPGLSTNTIGKQNKNFKVFLNWCFDKNIIQKFSTKDYPTIVEEVDKVYLTEEDLIRIEKVKLTDSLEMKVRDLFLIGCETALRFSDFIRISPHDIKAQTIHFKPKKTSSSSNNKVIIPLSNRLKKIIDHYGGIPPRFDANGITLFNKTIREVCRKAGLTEEIIQSRKVAGETKNLSKRKYEEVSSHTCRRTFCTLKFLKGMPAQAIMKFSVHKTERNFLKYLKLDAELTAKKYEEFF